MPLKLYNTYSHKKEIFKPINPPNVSIYNCGPTVYDFATIGNLRTFVFYDILRRTLEYLNYDVVQVMNITDVGHLTMTETQMKSAELANKDIEVTDTEEGLDRMQKAAKREGLTVREIADKYIKSIFGKDGDFELLNIKKPDFLPKATDHIQEQIDFIKKLEEKGYAYITKKAVYFDVQKFPKYEKLIEQNFNEMRKGERAYAKDPDRKHPADFRLWQLDQPDHPMQWDSPWGKGFPGWHIECSAMSKKYLGQPFDIHTGGEDHIKAHHPNEIAQSEAAYEKNLANYWLHASFLTIDGKKMSKSLDNAYTMTDIEKYGFKDKNGLRIWTKKEHINALALRYFFLSSNYRTKQNFTWKNFEEARLIFGKIIDKLKGYESEDNGKVIESYKKEFIKALEDDINTPEALAIFWKLIKSDENKADKLATILDFDNVFGLNLEKFIKEPVASLSENAFKLIKQRDKARSEKDWDKADQIRNELKEMGIEIKDTDQGAIITNR